MNKLYSFLLIATFLSASATKAKAAPYISYPDFVIMSQDSRYEVVRMMQDFTVEYEQQSRLYISKASKHTSYFDFLINSAYAASNDHGAPCMYAGWPSVMEEIGKQTYCNNPGKYWSSIDRYKNYGEQDPSYLKSLETSRDVYKSATSNGHIPITYTTDGDQLNIELDSNADCNTGLGAVICNPIIFGKMENKPFCVAANADYEGYNASFLCERAVNKLAGQDENAYKELMDGIIQEAMSSPEKRGLFLNTMKDMYDMCLCSQDTDEEGNFKNGRVSKIYADEMFNTRTCAGILYQSKAILDRVDQNQEVACRVFTDPVDDNKNWIEFVQQAHQNIETETNNLGRGFVEYLELKNTQQRVVEQKTIADKRKAAKDIRGGSFCPVDMEAPEEPACILSTVQNESADPEAKKSATVSFTPAEGKKFEDYTFSHELEFIAGANNLHTSVYEIEESSESLEFSALIGDEARCSAVLEPELEPEDDTDETKEEIECELALTLEEADEGVYVVATVSADGNEVKRGEGDYTVTFVNTSLEEDDSEDETNEDNFDTDGMVGAATADADDEADEDSEDKKVAGRELASIKEGDRFAAFVAALEGDQEIHASLTGGPEGGKCSETKVIVVEAPAPAQEFAPRGGPALKQPNLIQPRQKRPGFIMRGNR